MMCETTYMQPTRRDFFRNTALFGATLASAKFLTACADGIGDSDLQEGEYTGELAQSCSVPTITANHGHALTVPAADANAGIAKTYSIKGTSGHSHTVAITAAQFGILKGGGTITVKSTVDVGHSHDVTVKCIAAAPPPPACSNGATAQSISANHGHVLTIPKADAVAGVQKVYSIKGTSAHNHTVTITAANFVSLKGGQAVTVTSSADAGHLHTVKVICA
jgi:hypothetical protein